MNYVHAEVFSQGRSHVPLFWHNVSVRKYANQYGNTLNLPLDQRSKVRQLTISQGCGDRGPTIFGTRSHHGNALMNLTTPNNNGKSPHQGRNFSPNKYLKESSWGFHHICTWNQPDRLIKFKNRHTKSPGNKKFLPKLVSQLLSGWDMKPRWAFWYGLSTPF